MALRICSTPGCPRKIPAGQTRCDDCKRTADKARGTATERGYTSRAHRKVFRPGVLAKHPICQVCHVAPSTVADHHPLSRRDLEAAGLDPNDPQYGRGLCHDCHSRETAQHQPGGWHHPTE